MPAKVRDVIRRLEAEGWRLVRVAVSDHVYKREAGETITIPVHGSNKELPLLNLEWVTRAAARERAGQGPGAGSTMRSRACQRSGTTLFAS